MSVKSGENPERESEREENDRRRVEELMALLRGHSRLWHRTNIEGLAGILADLAIRPSDGSFKRRYTGGLCSLNGGVCLFDFDKATMNEIHQAAVHWEHILREHGPSAVLLRINPVELDKDNIRSSNYEALSKTIAETGRSANFIPYVEAYHVGPIPVGCVDAFFSFRLNGSRYEYVDLGPRSSAIACAEAKAAEWAAEERDRQTRMTGVEIDLAEAMRAASGLPKT